MSQQKTSVGYKQKLIAASDLKKAGRKSLYDLVVILVDVFEDKQFREDNTFDDHQAAELLDEYLSDTAITFLEGRAILEKYPKLNDWSGKNVRDLYESALESSAKESQREPGTRRSVTVAQFEKEQLSRKDAEYKVKTLEEEVKELRAENRRLTVECAHLEGRIAELEALLEKGTRPGLVMSR